MTKLFKTTNNGNRWVCMWADCLASGTRCSFVYLQVRWARKNIEKFLITTRSQLTTNAKGLITAVIKQAVNMFIQSLIIRVIFKSGNKLLLVTCKKSKILSLTTLKRNLDAYIFLLCLQNEAKMFNGLDYAL